VRQSCRTTPAPFLRANIVAIAATVLSALAPHAAEAQQAAPAAIPRTSDGRPDLQGYWSSRWLTPVERPTGVTALVLDQAQADKLTSDIRERADRNNPLDPELSDPDADTLAIVRGEFRSSLIIDPPNGKLPFTPAGRGAIGKYIAGLDGPEQRMTTERCIGGVGWAPLQIRSANMLHRIVQTPTHVVVHTEAYDDLRIIPLDVPHQPAAVTSPTGDSVAVWDGDALVVETRNIDPHFSTRGIVTVMSSSAKITERFELAGPDELVYRYTIDDPVYYTAPWTAEYAMTRTKEKMYEYACHEGNYSLTHMLSGARLEQRMAAKQP
jgi:hypothetical protein